MDAKELHDALSATPMKWADIAALAAANMSTILRALSLLAAAEASDGATPETEDAAGTVHNNCGDQIEVTSTTFARRLERERNGLAAEVLRLKTMLPDDYARADMESREP